jgi:hypothetical protein
MHQSIVSYSSAAPLVPLVPLVPLGRDWSIDLVALPCNAVRREIGGLLRMLPHLESGSASILDVAEARWWLRVLADFFAAVNGMLEAVIFRWLTAGGAPAPGGLSAMRRAVSRGRARDLFAVVDNAMSAPNDGPELRAGVDRLVNVLLGYLSSVESVVPQIAKTLCSDSPAARRHATVAAMAEWLLTDAAVGKVSKAEDEHCGPILEAFESDQMKDLRATRVTRTEMFLLLSRGFNDDGLQERFCKVYGKGHLNEVALLRFETRRIATVSKFIERGNENAADGG